MVNGNRAKFQTRDILRVRIDCIVGVRIINYINYDRAGLIVTLVLLMVDMAKNSPMK
jgi:hypothetical protein